MGEWLNSNGPAIIALATVVLVVITGVYAWLTHRLSRRAQLSAEASHRSLAESQRQHELSQLPMFVVTLDARSTEDRDYGRSFPDPRVLNVHIANTSEAVAIKPVVDVTSDTGSLRFRLLNVGWPPLSMDHDAQLVAKSPLTESASAYSPAGEETVKVTISYENVFGHRFTYWSRYKLHPATSAQDQAGNMRVTGWRWRRIGHDLDLNPIRKDR